MNAVDNDLYRRMGHAWWDDDAGPYSTIRFFINPPRANYFARVLRQEGLLGKPGATLLDVGCGGGLLTEEFARMGLRVTGVDPAPESVATARTHAAEAGLDIDYRVGCGEALPFVDGTFDAVACCDVLEHVDEPADVIAEMARVLKPGGLLLYDTVNRTLRSWFAVIKLMQDWPSTTIFDAGVPVQAHVWDKFLKPAEVAALLRRHNLEPREQRGIATSRNPLACWLGLRQRAKGLLTFQELGKKLDFRESDDLSVSYMGFAVKARPRSA